MDLFNRHQNVVLQFSGGKDSLACLYLLKPYWDRLTVLWINTGDAFRETLDQMGAIAQMVPHYAEARSNQPKSVERYGPPADLLSAWDTPLGHQVEEGRTFRVQTPFACCQSNIWIPLDQATRALRATAVIRGQRNAEGKKAPIRSGETHDGIEYCFPIEDWTGREVIHYLEEQGVEIPEHYGYVDSSLDCRTCTAYLADNAGKFAYLRERHPKLHAEVQQRLRYIRDAVAAEAFHLMAVCNG